MSWEFETDAGVRGGSPRGCAEFMREEVEPLGLVYPHDVYKRPQSEDIKAAAETTESKP